MSAFFTSLSFEPILQALNGCFEFELSIEHLVESLTERIRNMRVVQFKVRLWTTTFFRNLGRHSDGRSDGRNRLGNYGAGTNSGTLPDGDRPERNTSRPNLDVVLQSRVTLALFFLVPPSTTP